MRLTLRLASEEAVVAAIHTLYLMSIIGLFISIIVKFEKYNRVISWELLKRIIGKKRSIIDSALFTRCSVNHAIITYCTVPIVGVCSPLDAHSMLTDNFEF